MRQLVTRTNIWTANFVIHALRMQHVTARILHVGDKIIYLRSARRTTPSLMVKYADKLFYGNMSPNAPGDVKIKIGNTIYSLYDDSMIE